MILKIALSRGDRSERSGLVCLRVALARRGECIANKIARCANRRQTHPATISGISSHTANQVLNYRLLPAVERGTKMQGGKRACLEILCVLNARDQSANTRFFDVTSHRSLSAPRFKRTTDDNSIVRQGGCWTPRRFIYTSLAGRTSKLHDYSCRLRARRVSWLKPFCITMLLTRSRGVGPPNRVVNMDVFNKSD